MKSMCPKCKHLFANIQSLRRHTKANICVESDVARGIRGPKIVRRKVNIPYPATFNEIDISSYDLIAKDIVIG